MSDTNRQAAPQDPMTPAAESWAAMHEMYTGMREAGFTMTEAAAILAACIAQGSDGNADGT